MTETPPSPRGEKAPLFETVMRQASFSEAFELNMPEPSRWSSSCVRATVSPGSAPRCTMNSSSSCTASSWAWPTKSAPK